MGDLKRVGGTWYLSLSGEPVERGRTQARLVSEIVGTQVADYYQGLVKKVIRQQGPAWLPGFLGRALAGLASGFFGLAQLGVRAESLELELKAYLRELGRGGARRLIRFPDLLHWLAGRVGGTCSAVYLQDQNRLARNFDFYGPHIWGEYRACKLTRPTQGQAWLWVGPIGIPVGGFGINQAGIAVMPFTNFMRDLSLRGFPLFGLMQAILEEAESLERAREIILKTKRHGGISLMVVDLKNRDAFAAACGAKEVLIENPSAGVLVRTNHYRELSKPPTPEMGLWQKHSRSRWQRLDRLARDLIKKPAGDPLELRRLLADRLAHDGKRYLVGDVTGSLNVANSIILDGMELYLADAGFPACDATTWHRIDLNQAFATGRLEPEPIEVPDLLDPKEREALEHAVKGWRELFDEDQPSLACEEFLHACQLKREEVSFLRMAGYAASQAGNRNLSEELLKKALALAPEDRLTRLASENPRKIFLETITGGFDKRA